MIERKLRRTMRIGLAVAAALGALALPGSAFAAPPGPPTQGSFVIGDNSAQLGGHVTFWGARWWKQNRLSGGHAPASFKGYANRADMGCVDLWTTRPGNSSFPPAHVDDVISVIVASHVDKSGSLISGDAVGIAQVAVDPGYGPNPGHPGTGVVIGFDPCGFGGGTF